MGLAGSLLKVRFFSIKNINGNLYAKFDVIKPKKLLCEDIVIELSKLNGYSKLLENGLFVGVEQTRKDSLFVSKNNTKTWSKGHIGYFNMFDTLFMEDDKIREILGVDSGWDGEWNQDDILDGLTEKQIQQKIDEYNNDPWIKHYSTMEKIWISLSEIEQFKQKCEKLEIPKEIFNRYIKDKKEYSCTDCKIEKSNTWSRLVNPKNPNKSRIVCFDCSTKYKQLYVHSLNEKTDKVSSGAMMFTSDILKTKDKSQDEQVIHICANLKKINNEYVWVLQELKNQIIDFAQKHAKLGVIGKEVYEIHTENGKRKLIKHKIKNY